MQDATSCNRAAIDCCTVDLFLTLVLITAAFAGASANGFTAYGATPQRDSAAIALRATSTVADGTHLYARYDGALGGGSHNHVFNVGVRGSW
jgi:uncharacterized protein with beta-barrel porin domain